MLLEDYVSLDEILMQKVYQLFTYEMHAII